MWDKTNNDRNGNDKENYNRGNIHFQVKKIQAGAKGQEIRKEINNKLFLSTVLRMGVVNQADIIGHNKRFTTYSIFATDLNRCALCDRFLNVD